MIFSFFQILSQDKNTLVIDSDCKAWYTVFIEAEESLSQNCIHLVRSDVSVYVKTFIKRHPNAKTITIKTDISTVTFDISVQLDLSALRKFETARVKRVAIKKNEYVLFI